MWGLVGNQHVSLPLFWKRVFYYRHFLRENLDPIIPGQNHNAWKCNKQQKSEALGCIIALFKFDACLIFKTPCGSATVNRHGRLQVYICKWWMGHYRSATAKRHICWSNTRKVGALDRGTLTKSQREEIRKSGVKSATTKVNRKGKKSYTGTQFLRGTGWGT